MRPAVEPAFDAWSDGEVVARLGALLGLEGFEAGYDVRAVSRALAAAVPAFEGVHLDSVGEAGASLDGDRPAGEGARP